MISLNFNLSTPLRYFRKPAYSQILNLIKVKKKEHVPVLEDSYVPTRYRLQTSASERASETKVEYPVTELWKFDGSRLH